MPSATKTRPAAKTISKPKAKTATPPLTGLLRHDQKIAEEFSKLFESNKIAEPGFHLVGGDEVGRGSLMGPVVAGAAAFPTKLTPAQRKILAPLNDSKQLTASIRAELAEAIESIGTVAIGLAEKDEVDTINIHHASLLAIERAYHALCERLFLQGIEETVLLIDGRWLLPRLKPERQRAIIKGDGLSACIAAASVVAKHWRDTHVIALAREFPHYGWDTNMGYGTPEHKAAIAQHGPTPHHRTSFKW